MAEADPFDLERFVAAQSRSYDTAVEELSRCQKVTHWIWYIFPQIDGLGRSATAKKYAIKSLAEAKAYLAHPLLGPRLSECTKLVCKCRGKPIDEILYSPDDQKFLSSMTLFRAAGGGPEFAEAINIFYGGKQDEATLRLLDHAA